MRNDDISNGMLTNTYMSDKFVNGCVDFWVLRLYVHIEAFREDRLLQIIPTKSIVELLCDLVKRTCDEYVESFTCLGGSTSMVVPSVKYCNVMSIEINHWC